MLTQHGNTKAEETSMGNTTVTPAVHGETATATTALAPPSRRPVRTAPPRAASPRVTTDGERSHQCSPTHTEQSELRTSSLIRSGGDLNTEHRTAPDRPHSRRRAVRRRSARHTAAASAGRVIGMLGRRTLILGVATMAAGGSAGATAAPGRSSRGSVLWSS